MLYPRRCPACGDIVLPRGGRICFKCKAVFTYAAGPYCLKCGKPVEMDEKEYCHDCSHKTVHFQRGRALFLYDGAMRESVAAFKFHGRKEYADYYTDELAAHLGSFIRGISPELLVPVPIHKGRRIQRGFNQAELLCDRLGRKLGIASRPRLLIRKKNTLPQKELSTKERLKNLEEAFSVEGKALQKVKGVRRVMLVDDIYTTGATIDACAKQLLSHGVEEVYFICLCIGRGF